MKPAVINVDLAWGAACDLVLLVQDAAGVPLDLSGASLDFALKAGDASVPLAVDAADAAEGLVRVRVPGQDLGMYPWEGWLQTSPETPRERILRGLMTVTDKVDPRAEGNPSTHRYFVRLSDAVTVSVDSVDLAWWAYAHALKAQESMESLADSWPETVSEAKQDVHAVKEDALAAIRDKQADAVLAVGRAQKTATDKIAGAQADAVSAVQAAGEEAQGTITPLVQQAETAKDDIDQAERRINTAATDAATSATSAANSATAAANALAAMPQVDASGNMMLAGNITAAGGTFDGAVNANGGINSPSPVATMQSMTTLGAGYAAEAFDLSGYVDLRSIPFANAVNVSKVSYPYLMDKDLVVFREVFADNNFLSYPVIKFDRYNFAWGTFPPSSMVLSMGGTYMNFEAGEHNAIMGFALGQTSLAAQSVSEVASPYIYLNMYSRARAQMTLSIYYNTGDGEQVIVKPGRTQSINRLYLIYEQVNNSTARISAGVVYSSSNLGVTSREVTIYRMGEIAVDYYACAEKVIPFFSNNTTQPTISTMNRILGLGVYPGMLITDYFSKVI